MILNLYNLLNQNIPQTGVWKLLGVNGCSPSVTNNITGVSYADSTTNFLNYNIISSTNVQLGNTYNPLVDVTTTTNITNLYFSYQLPGCYSPVYLCVNVNDKPDLVYTGFSTNSCNQIISVELQINKTNPNIPNYTGTLNVNASNSYSGVTTTIFNNQTVNIPSTQNISTSNLGAGWSTIYATLGANGCLVNKSFPVYKKSSTGQRFWFHNLYSWWSNKVADNPFRFKLKGVTIKLKGGSETYYPNNNYAATNSNFGTSSYYNPPYDFNSVLDTYRFYTDRSNWLSNEIYTKTTVTSQSNFTFKPTTTNQGVVNQTTSRNVNLPLHANASDKFYNGTSIVANTNLITATQPMKFYVDVGDEVEWFIIDIVNFEYDPSSTTSINDFECGIYRLGSENTTFLNWYGHMDIWIPTLTPWRVFDSTNFPIGTTITSPVTPFIQYTQSLFDSNTQFAWSFTNNIYMEGAGYLQYWKPFKETITGLC